MTINDLLTQIDTAPDSIEFTQVMSVIDSHYHFTASAFTNGETTNDAGQNNGSCKILGFAKLHGLSESSTLSCFGQYYFTDVIKNPDGIDHQNIRQFMIHGWSGVTFTTNPLSPIDPQ